MPTVDVFISHSYKKDFVDTNKQEVSNDSKSIEARLPYVNVEMRDKQVSNPPNESKTNK